MDTLLLLLTCVAAMGAVAAAIGAWRRSPIPPPSSDPELIRRFDEQSRRFDEQARQIADLHRRSDEAADRLRAAFDAALRDSIHINAEAQKNLALQLLQKLDEFRGGLNDQFQKMQQAQDAGLTRSRQSQDERLDRVDASLKEFVAALNSAIVELKTSLLNIAQTHSQQSAAAAAELNSTISRRLDDMRQSQTAVFQQLEQRVQERLEAVRRDNEEKLEKIRATVDEKLHATLETRLGESFKLVSERLEQVQRGLGEMQTLAGGVGDLKRVLANVRTRGTFGEMQLEALLEQVLTPAQYDKNVATRPGSNERVEFAVRLPGREDKDAIVHLPIDAKFPVEDYQRLQDAHETADLPAIEAAGRGLRGRLLLEADSIREKYISPPNTTNFALMYLPTEGLFAEALRMAGLMDELQRRNVIPVGPTTLYAILNSLQMGFRTLAIQKRSGEVWGILGAVKTEFSKFGKSLEDVSKKLQEAGNKIDAAAGRSRVLERKLRDVEALPEHQTRELFSEVSDDEDEKGSNKEEN